MTFETLINGLEEALELAKNKNEQVNILMAEKETLVGEKNQLEADKASLQNQVAELEQAKLDAEVRHQAEVDALNAKIDELKKILATN